MSASVTAIDGAAVELSHGREQLRMRRDPCFERIAHHPRANVDVRKKSIDLVFAIARIGDTGHR